MRKWIYERPWIWIVLFLSCLIAGSIATVIIAEVNKPEIVKPKTPRKARGSTPSSQVVAVRWVEGATGARLAPAQVSRTRESCAGASGRARRGSTGAGCESGPGLEV